MVDPPEARRILIVDDEPDVVRYLEMLLQDQGYETLGALDGREAMELARQEKPDLVILDISMPNVSGTKVYREIRTDPELASIPVIIITAIVGFDGDPYAYENFISHRRKVPPPEGYFPKPIDTKAFLAAVRELLGTPADRPLQPA
ncbi:response regulator [Gemmatimonadota bacterium]